MGDQNHRQVRETERNQNKSECQVALLHAVPQALVQVTSTRDTASQPALSSQSKAESTGNIRLLSMAECF